MRTFWDGNGLVWQVWRVNPDATVYYDHRRAERRLESQDDFGAATRRSGVERRKGDLQQGWLCFEGDAERRRLYPIPPEWESCSSERLALLLQLAEPVRMRRVDHSYDTNSNGIRQ